MSSVGPSDGGYQYYQKTVQELEDEHQKELKRAKESADERVADVEDNAKAERARNQASLEKTVDRFKENSNEAMERDRATSKAERARTKAETYDKFGRSNGLEAETLSQQVKTLEKAREEEDVRNHDRLDAQGRSFDRKLTERDLQHRNQLEHEVRDTRDASAATFSKQIADEKTNYAQFRADSERRQQTAFGDRMQELDLQHARNDQALTESKADFERELSRNRDSSGSRLQQQQEAQALKSDRAMRNLDESHAEESHDLRGQIKDLVSNQNRYSHERAQGTQDAIRDFEGQHRDTEKVITRSYEAQLDDMRQKSGGMERYFGHLQNEALKEKDAEYAGVIKKQGQEARLQQKDQALTYEKDAAQLKMAIDRDNAASRKRNEMLSQGANEQTAVVLKQQAKAYQDTMARQAAADNDKVNTLTKQLRFQSTTDDSTQISPAAEASISDRLQKGFDKTLTKQTDVSREKADSIYRDMSEKLRETVFEKDASNTLAHQDWETQNHRDRQEFLASVRDAEFLKNEALKQRDADANHEVDSQKKEYTNTLAGQRREYEDMMAASHNDAQAKFTALRQESEFNSRMTQRAFSAKQSEIIRDYEKRLSDQKADYDATIGDVKNQASQAVREGERKTRQALDEQQRSYEQRIAQMEATGKERERYVTQNYQDELEKVRRSNALLVQKKS